MKKMMIIAATVAMTFASQALTALKPEECLGCGGGSGDCPWVVFKVTGSGKAVVGAKKGDYKKVGSLKIRKGALALEGQYCAATDSCCYDSGWFYATIRAGKVSFKLASEVEVGVWSVFGKHLEKVRGLDVKQGKTYKLDSALFIASAGATYVDDGDLDDLSFWASALGKVNVKISKGSSSSNCSPTKGCTPEYIPKKYSGWFVAQYACIGEEDCFLCTCVDTDIAGGTWKATYKSGTKTQSGAMRLAGVSSIEE